MTFAGENNGLKEIRDRAGHGRKKGAGMPRWERKRREKAGKVRPSGAWEKKRGWDAPLGAEKREKAGKVRPGWAWERKKAEMPRLEQRRKEEKVCLQTIRK